MIQLRSIPRPKRSDGVGSMPTSTSHTTSIPPECAEWTVPIALKLKQAYTHRPDQMDVGLGEVVVNSDGDSLGDKWTEIGLETRVVFMPSCRTLSHLPKGYVIMMSGSGLSATATSCIIVGHPSGHVYQTTASFIPHLQWLIHDDTSNHTNCQCELCVAWCKASLPPPPPGEGGSAESSSSLITPSISATDIPTSTTVDPATASSITGTSSAATVKEDPSLQENAQGGIPLTESINSTMEAAVTLAQITESTGRTITASQSTAADSLIIQGSRRRSSTRPISNTTAILGTTQPTTYDPAALDDLLGYLGDDADDAGDDSFFTNKRDRRRAKRQAALAAATSSHVVDPRLPDVTFKRPGQELRAVISEVERENTRLREMLTLVKKRYARLYVQRQILSDQWSEWQDEVKSSPDKFDAPSSAPERSSNMVASFPPQTASGGDNQPETEPEDDVPPPLELDDAQQSEHDDDDQHGINEGEGEGRDGYDEDEDMLMAD